MNEISHQFMTLINTMLENYDQWEVHSFKISTDDHALTYGKCSIYNWADGVWLIKWQDCLHCDSAHVNCVDREIITQSAYEALEFASANGYDR